MAMSSNGTNKNYVSYSRILAVKMTDTANDHTVVVKIKANMRITDELLDDIVMHIIENTKKETLDDSAEDTIRSIAEACALIEYGTPYMLSAEIIDEPAIAHVMGVNGKLQWGIDSMQPMFGDVAQYTIWHK